MHVSEELHLEAMVNDWRSASILEELQARGNRCPENSESEREREREREKKKVGRSEKEFLPER